MNIQEMIRKMLYATDESGEVVLHKILKNVERIANDSRPEMAETARMAKVALLGWAR